MGNKPTPKELTTGPKKKEEPQYNVEDVEKARLLRQDAVVWAFEEINPGPGLTSDPEVCFRLLLFSSQRCARLDLRPLVEKTVWENYHAVLQELSELKGYVQKLYAEYVAQRRAD